MKAAQQAEAAAEAALLRQRLESSERQMALLRLELQDALRKQEALLARCVGGENLYARGWINAVKDRCEIEGILLAFFLVAGIMCTSLSILTTAKHRLYPSAP